MKNFKTILFFLSIILFSLSNVYSNECMLGELRLFAGNFAPRGWAFANGQLLPINSNSALFSILGTTFGGDGRTTFSLPDLRGRVAVHPGTGPGLSNKKLGEKGGTENNYLNLSQLPIRTMRIDLPPIETSEGLLILNPNKIAQGVPNLQPFQAINYIICLQGIYPSRS